MIAAEVLDARATRWLAMRAFRAHAISPGDFDFIDENPERADEVPEFSDWLARPLEVVS